jgi:ribosomal protein L11 methyltransferase
MKRPSLWRVSVSTTPEAEDAVADLLGTALRQPVSAWLNPETGVSTVAVYLQQKSMPGTKIRRAISAGLRRIKTCGLNLGPGRVHLAKIRHEDWAESWKRHFQPIAIGNDLLIKPSWSTKRPRKNQAVMVLDPGLSFGTGQHPTTAFCLRELVRCGKFRAGRSFLDMGTGSGILAIAAVRLGYSPVHAFDIDPGSVRIARANARANGVHRKLRIAREDVARLPVRPARRYDLICANLISNLLISEGRRLVAQLKPRGTLVLAGILQSEFLQVAGFFAELGLKLAVKNSRNEWRSGSFSFAKEKFWRNLNDKRLD